MAIAAWRVLSDPRGLAAFDLRVPLASHRVIKRVMRDTHGRKSRFDDGRQT
jgi:hypothetical protein